MTVTRLTRSRAVTLPLAALCCVAALALGACDNSGGSKKNLGMLKQEQQFKNDTVVSGKVSYQNAPVKSGQVTAVDGRGKEVASAQLSDDSQYLISIPAMTKLPVILTFQPGSASDVPKPLISVIVYSSMTKYDISDLTTAIAAKAKAMGGYTPSNLTVAAENIVHVPDANKTSTGFRGDPTKQYGGWH